jgi:hypothetical protein
VLRLTGDVLIQVAELEEEAIEPPSLYDGAYWQDVKLHRVNRFNFGAGITNEVTSEIIKLNGAAPQYSYWLETDGTWHARQSNWNRRAATRVKLLNVSRTFLEWNSQEGRFFKS